MYKMIVDGQYGFVELPLNVFEQLDQKFFISHSSTKTKFMCANTAEKEHLQSLGVSIDGIISDWYKIGILMDERLTWVVKAYGQVIRGDIDTSEDQVAIAETDAIARRMAACWNACIGQSTESLERKAWE